MAMDSARGSRRQPAPLELVVARPSDAHGITRIAPRTRDTPRLKTADRPMTKVDSLDQAEPSLMEPKRSTGAGKAADRSGQAVSGAP
jgi:hypothetical protein